MKTFVKLSIYYVILLLTLFIFSITPINGFYLSTYPVLFFGGFIALFPAIWYGIQYYRANDDTKRDSKQDAIAALKVLLVFVGICISLCMFLFTSSNPVALFILLFAIGILLLIYYAIKVLRNHSINGNQLQQGILENQHKLLVELSKLEERVISIEKILKEVE